MGGFDHLAKTRTVAVTTYKRDSTPIATPVNVVVIGEHAYFRTWSTSGKAKRLRRDPHVLIAPLTRRGKLTGPAMKAMARLVGPEEEAPVERAMSKKYRLLQGLIVPVAHRVRHRDTVHYELHADDSCGECLTTKAG